MVKKFVEIFIYFIILLLILSFIMIYFMDNKGNISKNQYNVDTEEKYIKDNYIKGINYVSEDLSGNIYSIQAESGVQNLNDADEIFFEIVSAKITQRNKAELLIFADSAIYNNLNYNTNFKENVLVIYKNQKIRCDYLNLDFNENKITVTDNVVFQNLETKLLVDKIEIDLITKVTKLSMDEKTKNISINYKKYGIN